MKYFILLLAFVTTNVFANTVTNQAGIQLGGDNRSGVKETLPGTSFGRDMSQYKILSCVYSGANASACDDTFADSTLTAYQVPAGKTFTVHFVHVLETGAGSGTLNLSYCNTAPGFDVTSCGGTVTHFVGNGVATVSRWGHIETGEEMTRQVWPRFVIPQNMFPFVYTGVGPADVSWLIFGVEEDI